MSSTPVDTSGDLKVSEASHLSNLPSIATEASTSNLIALSTGVTLKTGTPSPVWACTTHGNTIDTRMQHRLSLTRIPPIFLLVKFWLRIYTDISRAAFDFKSRS